MILVVTFETRPVYRYAVVPHGPEGARDPSAMGRTVDKLSSIFGDRVIRDVESIRITLEEGGDALAVTWVEETTFKMLVQSSLSATVRQALMGLCHVYHLDPESIRFELREGDLDGE